MKQIKNKFSLFFIVVLVSGVFFIGINQSKAIGDAYFQQNTTVTLNLGEFSIVGGSDADTVTTNGTTTITVTISAGQNFTLESAGRKLLNNDSGFSTTCTESRSSINLTVSATKTVIITPSTTVCGSTGSVGGVVVNGGEGGTTTSAVTTPTPTPSPTLTPVPTTTPIPSLVGAGPTPISKGFTNLSALKLKEGDVISAAGSSDPDVYIVNDWGYKRLFLNPAIFGFYGHLGGFSKVKTTVAPIRDTLVTSGLFRNCETNDKKVYGVETTGEDTGMLHWVNTTGDQAIADDPDFFKKVFCINSKEFGWYKQSTPYTSVNQIPLYTRAK